MEPQSRVIIENVRPNIESGRYYAKCVINDPFEVTADMFADGHDVLNAHLLFKTADKKTWQEVPFMHLGNDAWRAVFTPDKQIHYDYKIEAWIDHALTWHYGLVKKVDAGVDVSVELADGVVFLENLGKQKLKAADKKLVTESLAAIKKKQSQKAIDLLKGKEIESLFRLFPEKNFKSEFDQGL